MPSYVNKFERPKHVEETILDENERKIGTIRIKPSSILWKPRDERQFYRISLTKFIDWITSSKSGATRTTS